MSRSKKGFTIVELVIVIAVVAILAAVLIPSFSSLNKKAKDSAYLQERTNQQIADLAEKVENQDYLTWEDLEAKLAEKLAAIQPGANESAVKSAIEGALAEFAASLNKNNSALTEAQVKAIVEKALEGQLTTAQVEAIVTTALGNLNVSNLNADQVQAIVNAAVKDLQDKVGNVGITKEEMETAVTDAIAAAMPEQDAPLTDEQIKNIVTGALNGFGYGNDISASDIESIVKDAIQNANDTSITVTISLNETAIELDAGTEATLAATVNPATVRVAWSSSNATVASVAADGKVTANAPGTAIITATTLTGAETASCVVTVTSDGFVAGLGTEASPFIISTAAQLQTINDMYEQGYTYFKVADGVTSIDCSGWPTDMKLNGSFDGNGATLVNLSSSLFTKVGYNNEASDVVIENFKVHMDTTGGKALVRNVFNSGTTTFRNIELYGTVEGTFHVGSFYNYGTANIRTGDPGASYTVNFENAKSYLTLIMIGTDNIGGMIGKSYAGSGNTLYINMDADSGYFGKMSSTNVNKCSEVVGQDSYVLNGTTESPSARPYDASALAVVKPAKTGDTWTVEKKANADHYVVSVIAQYDDYLEDDSAVAPNGNGLTLVASKETIEDPDAFAFNAVTSAQLVNALKDGNFGYEIDGGVLKVYVGERNAHGIRISLLVTQYDANDNIVATGTTEIYTF